MGDNIRQKVIDYNLAFGERRLDDVRAMLHPDLEFDGTARPTTGRDDYMSGAGLSRFSFATTFGTSSSTATRRSSSTTSSPTRRPAPCSAAS
jgi:hypothetical protein